MFFALFYVLCKRMLRSLHSFMFLRKECIVLLGLISSQKLEKERKGTLRSLKERKRMMRSERKGTRCPTLSKSLNSFCSNNKLSHLSSLLQYNCLTKIYLLFLFAKIFFHRNSSTPYPIHYPSYAHAQCRKIGKSTPQAKTIFLCWSISTY